MVVVVGDYHSTILKPLLLAIMLDALSTEFRTGCPCELLYAENLMSNIWSVEKLLMMVEPYGSQEI